MLNPRLSLGGQAHPKNWRLVKALQKTGRLQIIGEVPLHLEK